MTLTSLIKQRINQTNHKELLRSMDYNNLKRGQQTLLRFLKIDNTYLWLKEGSFDLKYNSNDFLQHLLKALNLTSEGHDELKQYKRRLDAISVMRNTPYIFISTKFKRKGEPLHVLAKMEDRRHIHIDKERLVFKSESEVLCLIGDIVKEQYILHHGKLNLWGKIYNYVYHHTNGEKYIFDTNGTLIQGHSETLESRAELKIGNQIIGGIQ